MAACKYGDPLCPCQDGDMCHYEGQNPMRPPIKTRAQIQAAYRARKEQDKALREVRGIYLPPELHAKLKEYVKMAKVFAQP